MPRRYESRSCPYLEAALEGLTSWPRDVSILTRQVAFWETLPNSGIQVGRRRYIYKKLSELRSETLSHISTRQVSRVVAAARGLDFISVLWLDQKGQGFSANLPQVVQVLGDAGEPIPTWVTNHKSSRQLALAPVRRGTQLGADVHVDVLDSAAGAERLPPPPRRTPTPFWRELETQLKALSLHYQLPRLRSLLRLEEESGELWHPSQVARVIDELVELIAEPDVRKPTATLLWRVKGWISDGEDLSAEAPDKPAPVGRYDRQPSGQRY